MACERPGRGDLGKPTGSPDKLERAAFPQYWPFPASPCHRAVNQKDKEFVIGLLGMYSSPGHSKAPAHCKINTVAQRPSVPGALTKRNIKHAKLAETIGSPSPTHAVPRSPVEACPDSASSSEG